MNKFIIAFLILLFGISCNIKDQTTNVEEIKKQIISVETAFKDMARKKGIEVAFVHFAAPDAVLSRNNQLFKGKKAIRKYFEENKLTVTEVDLNWKPDFVEVSEAGDLAYTYGKYDFSYVDSSGIKFIDSGIFHTIWKKQQDGNWLYIWD